MLYVEANGTIKLTRGDTAHLTVSIMNSITRTAHDVSDTDVLTLSVKKNIKDPEPCLQKTVTGSDTFHIEPDDTNGLEFGSYKYDVQLTTSGGDVYTVVEPSNFVIMQEVTCS